MPATPQYRGRFAPSPTGPLHFGSLIAALGSFLEAKKNNGIWLIRMEDLDSTRTVPGASDNILRTLECFGMHSDEKVLHQSQRTGAYQEALEQLNIKGMIFPCACSRREIADSALHGNEGLIYPGTCRNGIIKGKQAQAWRVRTDKTIIEFNDTLQGCYAQILENEVGDFVILRADGIFAYQLAVVVDDEYQGITHIVRGADLLASTPRQIWLQRLLNYSSPAYMHLPVAVNAQGEKLSKQTLAQAVNCKNSAVIMLQALRFLRQNPPDELAEYKVEEILTWAIENWENKTLNNTTNIMHD